MRKERRKERRKKGRMEAEKLTLRLMFTAEEALIFMDFEGAFDASQISLICCYEERSSAPNLLVI